MLYQQKKTNGKHALRLGIVSLLACTIIILCCPLPSEASEQGWTLKYDFNKGEVGDKVAKWDAAGRTRYTKEQSYEGGQAVEMNAKRGKENWGSWGGRIFFPKKLKKGDEIWWRVRTYWPKGVDYSADPRLKFLRIHTKNAKGKNVGYNDIYINKKGSATPFQYIYEGEQKWVKASTAKDEIKPDTWETYEFYLKLDDKSVDDGGQARVRFWKNGKLLLDTTDRKTLKHPDDTADAALIFTYWNSSSWEGQFVLKKSSGAFKVGETVSSSSGHQVMVKAVAPNVVFLRTLRKKNWREQTRPFSVLKVGDKLTGEKSKHTAEITTVLKPYPTMDIKMYVDDVVLTNKTPKGRDKKGNAFIGVGKKKVMSNAKKMPKSAP